MNTQPILSIYPNTNGFGYALFETQQKPIDYGMVRISPAKNTTAMEKIAELFTFYSPKVVVLRDSKGATVRSKRIIHLLSEIVTLANEKGITSIAYTREEIRNVFDQFGGRTKYEIVEIIVTWLPELEYKKPKERKIWMSEDYHMGIFDAFALVITHFYLFS